MKHILLILLRLLTLNYYANRNQKNALLILMFHQVSNQKSTFYQPMPVDAFKDLCTYVKKHFAVIKVSDIANHFKKSNQAAVIISFDDAHYDIIENALPVLTALDMPFNINIDTEILETGKPQDFVRVYNILNHSAIKSYWNEKYMNKPININRQQPIITENEFTELLSNLTIQQKREITEDLAIKAGMKDSNYSKMLSPQDVVFLKDKNVEIGSHSHTHPLLTKISNEQLHDELYKSKKILETLTNKKINILAYPNGVYSAEIEKIAKNMGYSILLQTDDQINYIFPDDNKVNSYKRINQYHQTLNEALAHTFGFINKIKKIFR